MSFVNEYKMRNYIRIGKYGGKKKEYICTIVVNGKRCNHSTHSYSGIFLHLRKVHHLKTMKKPKIDREKLEKLKKLKEIMG